MVFTKQQLLHRSGGRKKKCRVPALQRAPQRKGVCIRILNMSPKKPNSAQRKVVKLKLSTGRKTVAHVPGEGHPLQPFSVVLMRGGRAQDLPGVRYRLIRGKLDLPGLAYRMNGRSKYGAKLSTEVRQKRKIDRINRKKKYR